MKKQILTFVLAIVACAAGAAVVTVKPDNTALGNPTENVTNPSLVVNGVMVSTDQGTGAQEPEAILGTPNAVCLYAGNTMTVGANGTLQQMVFTLADESKQAMPELRVSSGSLVKDASAGTVTWTGTAAQITLTAESGKFMWTELNVTVDFQATVTYSRKPVIEPYGGQYKQPVEIRMSAGRDAKIFYTTDGTDPNEQSELYTGPMTIDHTLTLKAAAIEEGKALSAIATAEFVILVNKDIKSIAELLEENTDWNSKLGGTYYTYTGRATVTYQNGPNLYIEDETGWLLIYGPLDRKYKQGDFLTGFKGTFAGLNGTPTLSPDKETFGDNVGNEPYTISTQKPDYICQEHLSAPMRLRGYSVERNGGVTSTSPDADAVNADAVTVKLHNVFADSMTYDPVVTYPTDIFAYYDIEGLVGQSGGNCYLMPTAFAVSTGVEAISEDAATRIEMFDLQGRRVNPLTAPSGIYVVRQADRTFKVAR